MPFPRAMARAMMPRLVKYGWSGRKIENWLIGYGAGYRRQTMLSDIRVFRNLDTFSPKVMALAPEASIARGIMSEVDLRRARNYRVYGMGKYVDRETGRVFYHHISRYDNTLRSKRGYVDMFERDQKEDDSDPTAFLIEVDVLAIEHNRGLPY